MHLKLYHAGNSNIMLHFLHRMLHFILNAALVSKTPSIWAHRAYYSSKFCTES